MLTPSIASEVKQWDPIASQIYMCIEKKLQKKKPPELKMRRTTDHRYATAPNVQMMMMILLYSSFSPSHFLYLPLYLTSVSSLQLW